jgi:hypothetical protein
MSNDDNYDYYDELFDDNGPDKEEELRYRDEIAVRLVENVHEYLTFASCRDLFRLIGNNL